MATALLCARSQQPLPLPIRARSTRNKHAPARGRAQAVGAKEDVHSPFLVSVSPPRSHKLATGPPSHNMFCLCAGTDPGDLVARGKPHYIESHIPALFLTHSTARTIMFCFRVPGTRTSLPRNQPGKADKLRGKNQSPTSSFACRCEDRGKSKDRCRRRIQGTRPSSSLSHELTHPQLPCKN